MSFVRRFYCKPLSGYPECRLYSWRNGNYERFIFGINCRVRQPKRHQMPNSSLNYSTIVILGYTIVVFISNKSYSGIQSTSYETKYCLLIHIYSIAVGLIWKYTYIRTCILKNIKNVQRCRDGMPKSMQTRQG